MAWILVRLGLSGIMYGRPDVQGARVISSQSFPKTCMYMYQPRQPAQVQRQSANFQNETIHSHQPIRAREFVRGNPIDVVEELPPSCIDPPKSPEKVHFAISRKLGTS
ncbi:hypothetical protein GGR54DRAFT_599956 [Hypoxylon sp. NC1633]|nr:hypothetical protein GGR54DRAFT_599956 [Hypoxylon sp. NC1633]